MRKASVQFLSAFTLSEPAAPQNGIIIKRILLNQACPETCFERNHEKFPDCALSPGDLLNSNFSLKLSSINHTTVSVGPLSLVDRSLGLVNRNLIKYKNN